MKQNRQLYEAGWNTNLFPPFLSILTLACFLDVSRHFFGYVSMKLYRNWISGDLLISVWLLRFWFYKKSNSLSEAATSTVSSYLCYKTFSLPTELRTKFVVHHFSQRNFDGFSHETELARKSMKFFGKKFLRPNLISDVHSMSNTHKMRTQFSNWKGFQISLFKYRKSNWTTERTVQ